MSQRLPVRFPLRAALTFGAASIAVTASPASAQNSQDGFLPPVGNWSLPPSGQQPPAPTPTPTPTPQESQPPAQSPSTVPSVTPTPAPTPPPRAAANQPTPGPTPTPTPQQASPTPAPLVQPQETPSENPPEPPLADASEPTPQPVPDTATIPDAADQPPGGFPRWLIALVAIVLAGGAGWFLFRRRRAADEPDADAEMDPPGPVAQADPAISVPPAPVRPAQSVPVRRAPGEIANPNIRRAVPGVPGPVPAPPPPPPPPPMPAGAARSPMPAAGPLPKGLITTRIPPIGRAAPPPPPLAPAPQRMAAPVVPLPPAAQRPRANGGGLGFELVAQRITVSVAQLMLEFELIAENHTDIAVASLDVSTAMLTAHADQDAQIARFFVERPDSPTTALEVGPQMARGMGGKLAMPLAQVNRVETGGRTYCVPIMMIDARYVWEDGREERKSVAFVLGKGGQDASKLGPIFLDRGPNVTRDIGARLHAPMRKAN